jgi:transposase
MTPLTPKPICEAVTRANMRFVATKTPEQQGGLVLHRTRRLFIHQQTAVINAIRAHLAEFGIVAPVGRHGVEELLNVVANPNDKRVPEIARACLLALPALFPRWCPTPASNRSFGVDSQPIRSNRDNQLVEPTS